MANDVYNKISFEGTESDISRLLVDLNSIIENDFDVHVFDYEIDIKDKTKFILNVSTVRNPPSKKFLMSLSNKYHVLVGLEFTEESDWHQQVYTTDMLEEQINTKRSITLSDILNSKEI